MTPKEFRAWADEIRALLKDFLPNRDALLWVLVRYGGAASVTAAQFPWLLEWLHIQSWAGPLEKIGALAAFVGASMGWSWGAAPTRIAGPGTPKGAPPTQTPTPQELENARTIAAAAGQPPTPTPAQNGEPR